MGDEEFSRARLVLEGLESVGIDLEDVAEVLEDEGVTSFAKSFDELIERLENKAAQLGHLA
jgi:transaldolase